MPLFSVFQCQISQLRLSLFPCEPIPLLHHEAGVGRALFLCLLFQQPASLGLSISVCPIANFCMFLQPRALLRTGFWMFGLRVTDKPECTACFYSWLFLASLISCKRVCGYSWVNVSERPCCEFRKSFDEGRETGTEPIPPHVGSLLRLNCGEEFSWRSTWVECWIMED